eukprot:7748441-Lingulodinium_polyedra.AAC.1
MRFGPVPGLLGLGVDVPFAFVLRPRAFELFLHIVAARGRPPAPVGPTRVYALIVLAPMVLSGVRTG